MADDLTFAERLRVHAAVSDVVTITVSAESARAIAYIYQNSLEFNQAVNDLDALKAAYKTAIRRIEAKEAKVKTQAFWSLFVMTMTFAFFEWAV